MTPCPLWRSVPEAGCGPLLGAQGTSPNPEFQVLTFSSCNGPVLHSTSSRLKVPFAYLSSSQGFPVARTLAFVTQFRLLLGGQLSACVLPAKKLHQSAAWAPLAAQPLLTVWS